MLRLACDVKDDELLGCRERRLVAVQTTYGALLPPDMMHSSSDMSTTLMLSDAHISTSMGSGSLEFASEFPADAESDAQHLMFGSYEEEAAQVCSWPCMYCEQVLACIHLCRPNRWQNSGLMSCTPALTWTHHFASALVNTLCPILAECSVSWVCMI